MWQLLFTQPVFLWGIAFAAVPVIIHFFFKRRIKKVKFPSLRFIRASHEKQSRRFKLQEILLMIIRSLIIALLALAISRPVQKYTIQHGDEETRGRRHAQARNVKTSAVFIIDNSISMDYNFNGLTRLRAAKNIAGRLLDNHLRQGDSASVILPADDIPVKLDTLSYNLDGIKQFIASATPGFLPADIPAALAQARHILDGSPYPNRVIFLLTDLQQSGWRDAPPNPELIGLTNIATGFRNDALEIDAQIFIIDLGAAVTASRNAAVQDVLLPQKLFGRNEPVAMRLHIRNYGTARANVVSRVSVGARTFGQANLAIASGAVQELELMNSFPSAGLQTGTVELENDNLLMDNTYYFTVFVPDRVRVLVVDDSAGTSDFLLNAFNPAFMINPNNTYLIHPHLITSANIPGSTLSAYHTVVLADFGRMTTAAAAALRDYVSRGGSILLFLDEGIDIDFCNGVLAAQGLFPCRIMNKVSTETAEGDHTVAIGTLDFSHPSLQIFEKQHSLNEIKVRRYYHVEYDATDPSVRVISRYDNNHPFIIEYQPMGSAGRRTGTVMLFTTAPDDSMSDLPLNACYPPLLHETIKYLLNRAASGNVSYPVGTSLELIRFDLQADEEAEASVVQTIIPVETTGQRIVVPGIYTLGGTPFACNCPPEESDLTRVSFSHLKSAYEGLHLFHITDMANISEKISRLQFGRELWPLILALLLLLLVAEIFIANEWIKMRRLLNEDVRALIGGLFGRARS